MSFWFGGKKDCPYVTKEFCNMTHKNLEQRMSRQDKLLYLILASGISTFAAVIINAFTG